MINMRNWMLGAAVLAGGLSLGAVPAQAAESGIHARGHAGYIQHRPGMRHAWVGGYEAHGYGVPGRWQAGEVRGRERFEHFDRHPSREAYRHFGRGHGRGRDFDRRR
jgi:hypothetical protein